MDIVQTISLPIIVSVVYAVMGVLKAEIKSERFNTFIPLISATLGAVIGVVIYLGYPECIPAGNVCAAIIIGAASGWAATGANQTIKQIKKGGQGK